MLGGEEGRHDFVIILNGVVWQVHYVQVLVQICLARKTFGSGSSR